MNWLKLNAKPIFCLAYIMLKTRIITAIALVAVFIPALFKLDITVWAYCMLVLALLALYEWAVMIKLSV